MIRTKAVIDAKHSTFRAGPSHNLFVLFKNTVSAIVVSKMSYAFVFVNGVCLCE